MALLPPTGSSQAWMSTIISSATSSARGNRGHPANLAAYLAASSRMPLFEAEQLEQLEYLASGTTFKAYKCRHVESGAVVVVKKILGISSRPISNQPNAIASSVLQELQIASYPPLLKCKNIVSSLGFEHDMSTGSPVLSLVVEYSDIGTLHQYLASTSESPAALDWSIKRKLAVDIASGLKAIHQCRIIHGDLKPENILLFPCDDKESSCRIIAKVSDFGSSLIENEFEANNLSNERRAYHGTPLWVPPIVRKSLRVPFELMPRCDVFSFGLIVWTIYKGETYFESSWTPLGFSDIQFLDMIEVPGLLERWKTYLAEAQHTIPVEEIQMLEQVVGSALNDHYFNEDPVSTALIHGGKFLKGAFEGIQEIESALRRDETTGNRSAETTPVNLWQPFHMTAHSLVSSDHFGWTMQCQLRTQHLSTLEDADASPPEKIQAALQLSSCSATGFGCKKNVDEALNYLQTSAEWGSFAAQLALPRAFAAFSKPLPKLKSPDAPVASSPESPYFGSDIDIDEFEEDSSIDDQGSHTDGESQLQGRETNPELAEIVLDHNMSESMSDTSEDGYNVFSLAKAIDEKFWRTAKKTQEEYYCWTIQMFSHLFNVANSAAPLMVIGRHFLGIEDEFLQEYLKANWKAGDLGHTAYVKAEDGIPLEIPLLHHAIGCCDHELVELILKLGVDLASTDNDGHTPLHIACRSGDANITRILVRSGAKASIQDSTGRYPLHWLWMFEDDDIPDIASILVRAGANVNDSTGEHEQIFDSFYSQDHRGTALHMAIGVRNLAAVRELLNIGADVNSCPNESMLSPLELATQLHVPEIVEELLCRGAKLTSRFGGGWALHHVGVHIDPLKRWLMHGPLYQVVAKNTIKVLQGAAARNSVDINMMDDDELTAFMLALSERGEDAYVAEAFFDCGIQPPEEAFDMAVLSGSSNEQNASKLRLVFDRLDNPQLDWRSLLNLAIQSDSIEAIRILVEQAGKSLLEAQDTDFQTPLHWATTARKPSAVKVLLQLGADPNITDIFGIPPLGYALLYKSKEATRMLLESGVNLWLTDANGEFEGGTILFFGLSGLEFFQLKDERLNDQSMLGWLLSADLDESKPRRFPMLHEKIILDAVVSKEGLTVLHEAATLGDYESVLALVSAGASTQIKSKSGQIPLDMAESALTSEKGIGKGNLEIKNDLATVISYLQDAY